MTGSAEPTIEDLLRASGVRDNEIEVRLDSFVDE